MRTHNAWHLAMFDAQAGNVASALRILDAWLLPASARSPLDACDATALLWRLANDGVDVAGRWCSVSDAFERAASPGFWPYIDLHAALAHWSAGKQARVQRLVHSIAQCADSSGHAALRARGITQPGLLALGAWAEGRYGEAAGLLARLQPFIAHAGGSRVQLEIFQSVEREARRRQSMRRNSALAAGRSPLAPGGRRQAEFALERPVERGFGFVPYLAGNANDRDIALAQLCRSERSPPASEVLHGRHADQRIEPLGQCGAGQSDRSGELIHRPGMSGLLMQ
jgi:hypothetical protein